MGKEETCQHWSSRREYETRNGAKAAEGRTATRTFEVPYAKPGEIAVSASVDGRVEAQAASRSAENMTGGTARGCVSSGMVSHLFALKNEY